MYTKDRNEFSFLESYCRLRLLPTLHLFVFPGRNASILYEDIQSIQFLFSPISKRDDAVEIGEINDP